MQMPNYLRYARKRRAFERLLGAEVFIGLSDIDLC